MKKSSLLLFASMFTVLMMNAQNEQESPQEETTPKTGAGTEYVLGLGFNALNNSGAVFEDNQQRQLGFWRRSCLPKCRNQHRQQMESQSYSLT